VNDVPELDDVVVAELESDERVVYLATHPPDAWVERFGPERVRTCAISEPAMVGCAVGSAMCGLRPIVDLNRASFAHLVADQIVNQAAKMTYMSDGQYEVPLTITSATIGPLQLGAQHEQAPYAPFLNTPGIAVVAPGTLAAARASLRAAIRSSAPVLYFVSPLLAGTSHGADDEVRLGRAQVLRRGDDVTLVGIGYGATIAMAAAEELAAGGIECEVVDPVTLSPLDRAAIVQSVRRTGRVVAVDVTAPGASAATEVLTSVCEDAAAFSALRAAPLRVTAEAAPVPFARELERAVLPDAGRVVRAVRALAAREGSSARG
jgi:pyruvate dehydrogenase E1 component beta subunit